MCMNALYLLSFSFSLGLLGYNEVMYAMYYLINVPKDGIFYGHLVSNK